MSTIPRYVTRKGAFVGWIVYDRVEPKIVTSHATRKEARAEALERNEIESQSKGEQDHGQETAHTARG